MTLAAAILTVLLALIFSALGTAKILALQPMRELAAEAGLSVAAYRRIGLLEVAGAVGLLIGLVQPLIGVLAGAGLLLLLGGAVVVHLRRKAAQVRPSRRLRNPGRHRPSGAGHTMSVVPVVTSAQAPPAHRRHAARQRREFSILDRWSRSILPRAVALDDEVHRILARLGP
jgi:uncharacterized membrane protein YphA (DoxX/SURF4 family)